MDADQEGLLLLIEALQTGAPLVHVENMVVNRPRALEVRLSGEGYMLLHCACVIPGVSEQVVKFLIDRYPQVLLEKSNTHQWTPLFCACSSDNASNQLIELLIDAGPQAIEMEEIDGWTPIHSACNKNIALRLIRKMIGLKPQVLRKVGKSGLTVLRTACFGRASVMVLCCLVDAFPVACLYNVGGSTPYHALLHYSPNPENVNQARPEIELPQVLGYMKTATIGAICALLDCFHISAFTIPTDVATYVEEILSLVPGLNDLIQKGSVIPESVIREHMGVGDRALMFLVCNQSLQDLLTKDAAYQDLICGVIRMNQCGRNYIQQEPSNKLCGVCVLEAALDNVDCLFLHVRESPYLSQRLEGAVGSYSTNR
jgi:hypothetical protein